jgi:hypothetical protein
VNENVARVCPAARRDAAAAPSAKNRPKTVFFFSSKTCAANGRRSKIIPDDEFLATRAAWRRGV